MRGLVDRLAFSLATMILVCCATLAPFSDLQAQSANDDSETSKIPLFIDPSRVFEKPSDVPASITFVTSLDFPPFNFLTPEGRLAGFHVDLAREICEELRVRCQVRVVAFDRIVRSLVDGRGDAAIAGLAESRRTRRRLRFTVPYLRMAGRFVSNKAKPIPPLAGSAPEAEEEPTDALSVSIVTDSAHAAFIRLYFPDMQIKGFETPDAARQALKDGQVDLHFGDALSLSFWLQSDKADSCCSFHGGAYFDENYFGRGLSIALPQEATALRATLNYALQRIVATGKFSELYLRYFPVSLY